MQRMYFITFGTAFHKCIFKQWFFLSSNSALINCKIYELVFRCNKWGRYQGLAIPSDLPILSTFVLASLLRLSGQCNTVLPSSFKPSSDTIE